MFHYLLKGHKKRVKVLMYDKYGFADIVSECLACGGEIDE